MPAPRVESGAFFVVVDDEARMSGNAMASFTPRLLVPLIESYPGRFQTVFTVPGSRASVVRVK